MITTIYYAKATDSEGIYQLLVMCPITRLCSFHYIYILCVIIKIINGQTQVVLENDLCASTSLVQSMQANTYMH
jgi:hypothetical protein